MKYALITGSGSGIGEAIANKLEQNGYYVIRNGRSKRNMDNYIQADLSNMNGVSDLVSGIKRITDKLDCLVLCVGTTVRKEFGEVTWDEWENVMNTNVSIPFFIIQALEGMIADNGAVVFIGSQMGEIPHASSIAYGVSKAAEHMLAQTLVKEFAKRRIRVNVIAPGFINTDWQNEKPLWLKEKITSKIALGRFGETDEVADLCYLLCENQYINGSIVTIDGGYNKLH